LVLVFDEISEEVGEAGIVPRFEVGVVTNDSKHKHKGGVRALSVALKGLIVWYAYKWPKD
jgi:hypothetical protein